MRKVRAAVLEAPGQIAITDYPYPKEREGLIIKMELAGICGTDKHTFLGHTKQYPGSEPESNTPFPIIQGHENVGIIEEICSGDKEYPDFYGTPMKVGDRITMCPDVVCGKCWYCKNTFGYPWCDNVLGYGNAFSSANAPHLLGGFAEYMYVRPDVFVFKVPDSLRPEIAVLAELFNVTLGIDAAKELYSLANLGFGSSPNVLVTGVGPLGLLSIIRLRIMGADTIIATDRSSFRLQAARHFGADYVLNIDETEVAQRVEITRERTHGLGVDLVVDCANEATAFPEGLDHIRRAGTLIELGNFVDTGTTEINVSQHICTKNIRIVGVANHPYTEYSKVLRMFMRFQDHYDFKGLISHRYSLEQTEAAMKKSMQPDSLKVVIAPN